jgi:hypothetical protein
MRKLLNENQKHLLWLDEAGDEFLLTKHIEIFRYNKLELKCYCWTKKVFNEFEKKIIIFDNITDDKLIVFRTKIKNLEILLKAGTHNRRPNIKGLWLMNLKKRLAHDILIPGNLESINHTVRLYSVKINNIRSIVKAISHKQAIYFAWNNHPDYDGKVTSLKNVQVRMVHDESDIIDTASGGNNDKQGSL